MSGSLLRKQAEKFITMHFDATNRTHKDGKIFYVDSVNGRSSNSGRRMESPLATWQQAVDACTASRGDTIFFMPGHVETFSAAAAVACSKAGIKCFGLGVNNQVAQFTFDTANGASVTVTAADVVIKNVIFIGNKNGLTQPLDITGANPNIDITYRDTSSSIEAVNVILATTVARGTIKLKYEGFTAGSNCATAIKLVGCSRMKVDVDFYGKASTAIVNFLTTAVVDVEVTGKFYNSGTTDFTKNVVDTVGGSTWSAKAFDRAAGSDFSGGSGAALAGDDVSAIAAALTVPTADATTNANQRDVVGNKTDAAVTTVGTTKSLMGYIKGLVQTLLSGAAADGSGNSTVVDVVGNKTDAAVYTIGTTNSILAYIKGLIGRMENSAKKAAATITNGQTLFTIAGGPIEILSLTSVCVTPNDATASTLQFSADGTDGNATTFSGASASLANAAAGAIVALDGTAVSTAPNVYANGVGGGQVKTMIVPAGVITAVVGVGSTTGTWSHQIRYRPLVRGVTVT